MKFNNAKFLRGLSRLVLRQAVGVSLFGGLLAVVGSYYTFLLYKNLRTNIEELLPTTARSVVDLDRLGKQVKSVENLVVLTFSADAKASKRFVIDLARALEALPKTLIAGVEYRIDGEIDFFRKRGALFLDLDELKKLKTYVADRIVYEKGRGLAFSLVDEPQFDFEALKRKHLGQASFFERFPDGFFASSDQTKRAIIVNLPGRAADIDTAVTLKNAVEKAVATLNPKSYAPDLEVRYTGNTANLIEEHSALIADLNFTSIVVMVLVAGSMLFFFRTFWATGALFLTALMGTLWTMGLSYFLTGYLNANSAFLASIVLGNGINFGIIFLARYLEERRRGRGHNRAVVITIKNTANSTLVASLAAGTSYGSLMLTEFRGFNQFGVIGLSGMILCWIGAFTVLPSFLTILHRWRGVIRKDAPVQKPIVAGFIAGMVERYPRAIVGVASCLTLAAILTLVLHDRQVLELDMNKLRDRTSMQSGSGYYYRYIAEIFGKNLSPMVILPGSRSDAREIASALRMKKEKEGEKSLIAWVQTLDDMVPADQEKKIEVLKEFKTILNPTVMKWIPTEYRDIAQNLAASSDRLSFRENELSPLLLDRFTEVDNTRGRIVLVDKPVVKAGEEENALVTVNFIRELRSVVDKISPGTAIVGQLPITADMVSAILQDGPKATLFACGAVFLLVALMFRNLRIIALVSFALWIGVLWLAGLILGLDLKINFLNFIALPITFGIGVDYGVNIFQRYREDGKKSIADAIRHTGGAVGLCSLTTVIGYTSLILAGNQAFVSFGTVAVLGELSCALAAIVYLPAYLLVQKRTPVSAPVEEQRNQIRHAA